MTDLRQLLVDLAMLRRSRHPADPKTRTRFVDEVDCLVREETVRDVAVGEVRGSYQGLVGDRHLVVLLVPVAKSSQDLDRVCQRRLLDLDRLEPPFEGGVLLEMLSVLVERSRTYRLELAAGKHRLEDRGGVDGTLCRTGADESVKLVDEQDDVSAGPDLLQDLLETLLEVTPVTTTGYERAQVEGVELLALKRLRDVVVHDLLGQPFDDGGLANTRLTDENRVVLRAPRQHLHDSLDLPVTADDGIELVLTRQLGQVPAELVEQRRAGGTLRARGAGRGCRTLTSLVARKKLDDLLAHACQVGAQADEDLGGHTLALAHEAEQHVLGADVVVAELQRLPKGQLEDLLRARRERWGPCRGRARGPDRLLDFLAHGLERDAEGLQCLGRDSLALVNEAEQDVLGPDEAVVQKARLLLSQDQYPACPIGESLEQLRLPCGVPCTGSLPVRCAKTRRHGS